MALHRGPGIGALFFAELDVEPKDKLLAWEEWEPYMMQGHRFPHLNNPKRKAMQQAQSTGERF